MTWATYRKAIEGMREAFPGCMPCEINLFAYASAKNNDPLRVNPERCYVISTNVYDDNKDRWEDFSVNNWAFTGGPGKGGWREYDPEGNRARYKVDEPAKGDILLARFAGQGHGIGVVIKNDYADALADESRLNVIWLNKTERNLSSGPRSVGFSGGHGKIGVAFRPPSTAEARRARYEELTDEERVEFLTFHQSYGYEEFVGGLRPKTDVVSGGCSAPGIGDTLCLECKKAH